MNGKECGVFAICSNHLPRGASAYLRALMLCVVLVSGYEMSAQVNTGTLSGQVTDVTSAVIPNAQLTIRDNNTGYTREVKTDGDGNYSFPDLPIGHYTITVEASGFGSQRGTATINVGVRSRSDFQLHVGSTGQTVEVSASESALSRDDASIGSVVTQETIKDTPL